MLDCRQSHRKRTYLGGRIVFNHRQCTLDCLIRNVTSFGAKLQFSDAVSLPDRFELTIPIEGKTKGARVIWLQGGEAGVAFKGRSRPDATPFDISQIMAGIPSDKTQG